MSRIVEACPECSSSRLRKRVGGIVSNIPDAPGYLCEDCKAEFDEPVERPCQSDSPSWSAATVLKRIGVDPEEAMVADD